MRKRWAVGLTIVFAVALLVSCVLLLVQHQSGSMAVQEIERAAQIAEIPSAVLPVSEDQLEEGAETVMDPYLSVLSGINLDALRQDGPDVVGWLYIPDTVISFPIVQGKDNHYYLRHTWNGGKNRAGAIFLDNQVDPTFGGFNTIVYGHNMRSDAMFSHLKYFGQQDYWEQHPVIYVVTDKSVLRYLVYAAWKARPTDTAYYLSVERAEDKSRFFEQGIVRSLIETGIQPALNDKVLTLSTCLDWGKEYRWVVQAVLSDTLSR